MLQIVTQKLSQLGLLNTTIVKFQQRFLDIQEKPGADKVKKFQYIELLT